MISLELENRTIDCPYCGESFLVQVDTSAGDQEYVEDCEVCCQPVLINVSIGIDDNVSLNAVRENE
jgi:transcription elongation factor Elf1